MVLPKEFHDPAGQKRQQICIHAWKREKADRQLQNRVSEQVGGRVVSTFMGMIHRLARVVGNYME